MKVEHRAKGALFQGENGETLHVLPSTMGEPYREGVELTLQSPDYADLRWVFLDHGEGIRLRDALNGIFPQ